MSAMRGKDREETNMLHRVASGLPRSNRDASSPVWNNPPTPIPVPGQRQPGNPYGISRLQDNLYAPKAPSIGNQVSRRTVAQQNHARERDPQRTSQRNGNITSSYFPLSGRGTAGSSRNSAIDAAGSSSARREPLKQINTDSEIEEMDRSAYVQATTRNNMPSDPSDVVVIDTDDEQDAMARERGSSPDPMDCLPSSGSTFPSFSERIVRASYRGKAPLRPPSLPSTGQTNPSKDTPADDNDSIQSFDMENEQRPRPAGASRSSGLLLREIPRGRVTFLTTEYERIPRINLASAKSVKDRMKPKNDLKVPPALPQLDPIATSSSGFTNAPRRSLPSSTGFITLPLKSCVLGTSSWGNIASSMEIVFNTTDLSLKILSHDPPQHISLSMCRDLRKVMYSQDHHNMLVDPVIIRIETMPPQEEDQYGGLLSDADFQPGQRNEKGKITLRFNLNNESWSASAYQALVYCLSKNVMDQSSLDVPASKSVWQLATNAIEMARRTSRKTSDRKNVRSRSPTNTSVSTPKDQDEPELKRRRIRADDNFDPPGPLRRSMRQVSNQSARPSPSADSDEILLIYPPTGTGAVNITRSDLNRLQPGEYLNDTLIEFGLKLWLNELRENDPELAAQIHVFSSFFYKKLNQKKLEDGYESVRKWTSKVDLFSKKYIIVPINEHLHWYLAIIYEPEHVLLTPPPPIPSMSVSTRGKTRELERVLEQSFSDISLEHATAEETIDVSIVPSRPTTPNLTEEEDDPLSLEQFQNSCSISSGNGGSDRPPSISTIGSDDPTMSKNEASDISSIDELQYPPLSEFTASSSCMDVDEPAIYDTSDKTLAASASTSSGISSANEASVEFESTLQPQKPVSVSTFYATTGATRTYKARQKINFDDAPVIDVDPVEQDRLEDQKQEEEVDEMLAVPGAGETPSAYIFTFDSLGSRHPQAIKNLKHYLKMEAQDKKGVKTPSEAIGKQAQVPPQPNYCDCGIYLLHFVKTFMKNPTRHSQSILSRKQSPIEQRRADWEEEAIPTFRQNLTTRIEELSQAWKSEKAAKEERKKKDIAEPGPEKPLRNDNPPSSDSEVDIVEDLSSKPKSLPKPKVKVKAMRMRG